MLALLRPRANKATFVRAADRLAVFDPSGSLVRSVDGSVMFLAPLGVDRFIASHDRETRFVIYDPALEVVEQIAMHEPGRAGYNQIVALPSGREWSAVGGHGEWDHYGELALGPPQKPTPAPKAKPAPKANKPSATRPAGKKR